MRVAETGDAAGVAALLGSGPEAIGRRLFLGPETGEVNALDLAVAGGHEEVVRLLLEAGAAPSDRASVLEDTPLMRAARGGHVGILRRLIAAGADTDEHDFAGSRPLMLAALFGHREAVEALLDLGAVLDCESADGYTALLYGVHGAHPEVVRLLAARGARINRTDNHGFTYLMHPLTGPHFRKLFHARRPEDPRSSHGGIVPACDVEMVRLLLALGADVHQRGTGMNDGKTVLMQAALEGQQKIVDLLLEAGADLHAVDAAGRTAVTWALLYDRPRVAASLRRRGAAVSLVDAAMLGDIAETRRLLGAQGGDQNAAPAPRAPIYLNGSAYDTTGPPLIWAVKANRPKAIETLLEAGADVEVRDQDGRTPLMHAAARFAETKHVARLLRRGANPNAADGEGPPALFRCATPSVTRALLAAGADVNARHRADGRTCLMKAAADGDVALIRVLLAAGADVSPTDTQGWTALHHACQRSSGPGAIRALLAAGADRNARTADGETPLDLARRDGRASLLKALRDG